MKIIRFLMPLLLSCSITFAQDTHTVSRVMDGHTLELSNGEQVRLMGVNAPAFADPDRNKENADRLGIDFKHYESYAQEAKGYLKRSFEGRKVRLEYDESDEKVDHRDQDGRLLAYVFLDVRIPVTYDISGDEWYDHVPNGKFYTVSLNGSLIKQGYSPADVELSLKYKDRFLALEQEAKENKRGIWQSWNLKMGLDRHEL